MFVSKSKFVAMKARAVLAEMILEQHHNALKDISSRWADLVDQVNKKGGKEFLEKGVIAPPPQLDDEDIKRLVFLCHPDKHGDSKTANDMTAKLLKMKGA